VLLGRGPTRDELRVEISLAAQRATIFKTASRSSTRRSRPVAGFDTPPGEYVVTDKKRSHRSSIYHVEMPFFMRLIASISDARGCGADYPASHGCIRVPKAVAEKLFAEIPVGTVVTIN
jgi:lipoprotein-anchoring transpeptidase ErfK/SrfK